MLAEQVCARSQHTSVRPAFFWFCLIGLVQLDACPQHPPSRKSRAGSHRQRRRRRRRHIWGGSRGGGGGGGRGTEVMAAAVAAAAAVDVFWLTLVASAAVVQSAGSTRRGIPKTASTACLPKQYGYGLHSYGLDSLFAEVVRPVCRSQSILVCVCASQQPVG